MSRVTARARLFAGQPWSIAGLAVVFMTLALLAARPAGAEDGALFVSSSPDRGGATALEGATLSGPAYIFLSTGEDVQRVVFSLDGGDVQVENYAPYDFAGGDQTTADAWSTGGASDGSHSIGARVSLVGGGEFIVNASFTVDNAPAPEPTTTPGSSSDGTLLVSQSADRSGASALDGATLEGAVYVFFQTGASAERVEFTLDGQPHRTENFAPYDFASESNGAANPWLTSSVDAGSHTIAATAVLTGGGKFTVSATFNVPGDGDDPDPDPTATATPPPIAATGELLISGAPDRSSASALGSADVSGDAFVFLVPNTQLAEVRFHLDGTFVRTEKVTPFDFGGTGGGVAGRWDTTGVADGTHVIEAVAKTAAGESFSVSASFTVDNDPTQEGDSEISTTSEDPPVDPPVDRSIELYVSGSANRTGAATLGADPITGTVYIFAVPSETPDRVRFYINPTEQPLPARTEQVTPYDLGGTQSNGSAGSFDTESLDDGVHTLLVIAEYGDGANASVEVQFTIEQPEVSPEVDYQLLVSDSANRSGATALDGAELDDAAYIFVSPADHVEAATFYLDDPARASADRVDAAAPFDLVGGGASVALPFEIDDLSSGDHALTVVLTRSDGTTTEAHATFSIGGTTLPNGAILIKTSDNASQVAAQHGPGTTFYFEAGLHRGVSVTPESGDVFLGAPGAVLSGAKILTGWSPTSGFWSVGGQTSQLTGGQGGCMQFESGGWYDACQYPEQLFVDSEPWWQVTSIGRLEYGTWYFDYAANRVYIGGNPAGHVIELSTVDNAFDGSANDVTISGLVVEKYANRAQTGAINGGAGNRWTISGNETRLNHGYGIRAGDWAQVLNNNAHHNGQIGIGGVGDYILLDGNEIAYNNTAGFLPQWEGGGTKFAFTDQLVVRNNWVHHNEGRGLWTDIDNINVLMVGNLVEYNSWSGIAHEIGYAAEFRENVSRYNGHGFSEWEFGAQIVIQNSSDVLVIDNDVTVAASGGGNGITVVDQERGSGIYGPHVSDRVTVTGNTIRHLGISGVSGSNAGCYRDITFDDNTYIAKPLWFTYRMIHWCSAKRFDEFQDVGQEANGTAIVS